MGNIGAHMEKDVNLVIDIEPGEAQILIDLIEMLFDEWYVEREARAKRLTAIANLSKKKAHEISQARSGSALPAADPLLIEKKG